MHVTFTIQKSFFRFLSMLLIKKKVYVYGQFLNLVQFALLLLTYMNITTTTIIIKILMQNKKNINFSHYDMLNWIQYMFAMRRVHIEIHAAIYALLLPSSSAYYLISLFITISSILFSRRCHHALFCLYKKKN